MTKSADAFRTISEVAADLDLPQHVLRFWETRFPQIRPLKRAGGRRFYRPADILLLTTIRRLLYGEGYTIKGVQRLLKDQGARAVQAGVKPDDNGHPMLAKADGDEVAPATAQDDDPDVQEEDDRVAAAVALRPAPVPGDLMPVRNSLEAALSLVTECERILRTARGLDGESAGR